MVPGTLPLGCRVGPGLPFVRRTSAFPRTRGRQLATFTGGEIRVAAATPDPLPLLRHEGSLGDEDQVLGCPVETDPLLFYLFIYQLFARLGRPRAGEGSVHIAGVETVAVASV